MGIKDKIDKIFFLPPSFHAIVSGAVLGGAVNLITGLLFAKDMRMNPTIMDLAIIFLICSAMLFGYISIVLEILREKLHEIPETERHLSTHIKSKRKTLWLSFFAGIVCVIASSVCIYLALR